MAQTKETPKSKAAASKPEKPARKTPVQKTARKSKKPDEPPEVLHSCLFCRRSPHLIRRLIAGPNNAFICEECVEVCVRIFVDETPVEWGEILNDIMANPEVKTVGPSAKKKQPKAKKCQES